MGKFKASRKIVQESWTLLKQDKEIMWFPVLSAIISVVALLIVGLLFYVFILNGSIATLEQLDTTETNAVVYGLIFVCYLITFFIVNFFQAGIFIIAYGRFTGQNLSFSDGIRGAAAHAGKIFWWSLISATVGVVLKIISDRSSLIGKILAGLLGAAWNILTYFSLPSLVIGKMSVKDSFKDSASVIRKTWGEAIIINFGAGLFFSLLILAVIAVAVALIIIVPEIYFALVVITLAVLAIIVISIISSSLNSIFKLALYEYARTGQVPPGFTPELIQEAIKVK